MVANSIAPEPNERKRPIGLISFDTKTLYERLSKANVGEMVTYEEMNALLGRDVRNGAYTVLQSARRMALNNGLAFGTVEKVGLKRLNDIEIAKSCEHEYSRMRRHAGRVLRRLACVRDYQALPRESKIQYDAGGSFCALIRHLSAPVQIKKLEAKVTQGQLPLQKTLEAFKLSARPTGELGEEK